MSAPAYVSSGSRTASLGINPVKNSDALHWRCLKVGLVSGPAGQEFKKPPFDRISWPTTGYQSIAVAAELNLHRQLWPKLARSPHPG